MTFIPLPGDPVLDASDGSNLFMIVQDLFSLVISRSTRVVKVGEFD